MVENTNNSKISERLKYLRNTRDWSKTYVAEKLGVKVSTYANWEYGTRQPKKDSIVKKIADLYQVPVEYVQGYTDEMDIQKHFKDNIELYKNVIIEPIEQKELSFIKAIENPELKRWFVDEIFETKEEQLLKLKKMWDLINDSNK